MVSLLLTEGFNCMKARFPLGDLVQFRGIWMGNEQEVRHRGRIAAFHSVELSSWRHWATVKRRRVVSTAMILFDPLV